MSAGLQRAGGQAPTCHIGVGATLWSDMTTSAPSEPFVLDSVLSILTGTVGGGEVRLRWSDDEPGRPPGVSERSVEHSLIERARDGDDAALDQLCRREWLGVLRLVRASVANPEEAEEVTQEVFTRAIASLPRFRITDAPFQAYLAQIARNLLRDRWRRARVSPEVDEEVPDRPTGEAVPEAVVLASDQRQVLLNAIEHLPHRYREVLRLRVLEGRTAAEIGAYWGRSPEAVRQIQHRALLALRGEMAAGGWGSVR